MLDFGYRRKMGYAMDAEGLMKEAFSLLREANNESEGEYKDEIAALKDVIRVMRNKNR